MRTERTQNACPASPWPSLAGTGRRWAAVALSALLAALALSVLPCASALAATAPPTLNQPASSAVSSSPLALSFSLPEEAAPGTVEVIFKGPVESVVTLTNEADIVGLHIIELDVHSLSATGAVASATQSSLPDGEYSIKLSYENKAKEPAASVEVTGVQIITATAPPTLGEPAAEGILEGPFKLSYTLPEAATANSVQAVFENEASGPLAFKLAAHEAGAQEVEIEPLSPLSASGVVGAPTKLPPGTYSLYISYEDSLKNPAARSTPISVTVFDAPRCAPGQFSASGEAPCTPAPAGRYTSTPGATVAIPCPPNSFAFAEGSDKCTPCPEGMESQPGSSTCRESALHAEATGSNGSTGRPPASGSGGSQRSAPSGANQAQGGSGRHPAHAPKLRIRRPKRQASLRRSRRQRIRLVCPVSGVVLVRVSAVVALGRRRIRLKAHVLRLKCHAGRPLQHAARFRLSKAARALLEKRHTRVILHVKAYERASGGRRHTARARLRGRR